MFLIGRLSLLQFLIYVLAQFVGAFIGSFFVWLAYYDALQTTSYDIKSAAIFATYPNTDLSIMGGFLDELIATSLLIIVVLALNDKYNTKIANETSVIIVSFLVSLMGTSFNYNCGGAVNPARDLSPRIFTSLAGWGLLPFKG